MNTSKGKLLFLIFILFLIWPVSTQARTATVPINITVNGVFRVTEEVEAVPPMFNSLKIRTNQKNWKLIAHAYLPGRCFKKKSRIYFEYQYGSKANKNSFTTKTIARNSLNNLVLIKGNAKTSALRDSSASDNWVKIIAKYKKKKRKTTYLVPELTYTILSL